MKGKNAEGVWISCDHDPGHTVKSGMTVIRNDGALSVGKYLSSRCAGLCIIFF